MHSKSVMELQQFADQLLSGGLVVFPTETVYGLGAVASHDQAVQEIFRVKGRPQHNPLILHVADPTQVKDLVNEIPESAKKFMDAFWPGPLTICFQKSEQVSDVVTGGLPTVCVRCPDHPIAHKLLSLVGKAVAAPSANMSGKPSTTSFVDAQDQLEHSSVMIIDGGVSPLGLESTVVDCSSEHVRLLRPGCIGIESLEEVLGELIEDASRGEKILSPGQTLEHYAPEGELTVIVGDRQDRRNWISEHLFSIEEPYLGYIGSCPEGFQGIQLASEENDFEKLTAQLYKFLNQADREKACKIVLEIPKSSHSLFSPLMNRLEKASQGNIVRL